MAKQIKEFRMNLHKFNKSSFCIVALALALFAPAHARAQDAGPNFPVQEVNPGLELLVLVGDGAGIAIEVGKNLPDIYFSFQWASEADGGPVIFVNGKALETEMVSYQFDRIQVVSQLEQDRELLTTFTISDEILYVQVSDLNEKHALRFLVVVDEDGTSMRADRTSVCKCWGGDATTVKTECTAAQCNDAGTTCNSAGSAAYCEWRAQPKLGELGDVIRVIFPPTFVE